MKSFLKQIILMVVVIVAFAIIQHRAPTILPAPPESQVHGSTIQIPVTTLPSESAQVSWQLIELPSHQYQVIVRDKSRVAGKFNATILQEKNTAGQTFRAAGTAQFGTQSYYANTIHVNASGTSGYIVFQKNAAATGATSNSSADSASSNAN